MLALLLQLPLCQQLITPKHYMNAVNLGNVLLSGAKDLKAACSSFRMTQAVARQHLGAEAFSSARLSTARVKKLPFS